MILAMARGAGEVAPLMLVGVVKLAPSLAINSSYPFVHLDQKFMHLGFHIYDLGFQSTRLRSRLADGLCDHPLAHCRGRCPKPGRHSGTGPVAA